MLTFEGLSKRFPGQRDPAVVDFRLEVRNGEILGLVGLNGAGKTTTIRVAAGLALPTRGTVRVDGHDIVTEKIAASSLLGWVPEFPNFEPRGTALGLLEYFAGYHRLDETDLRGRCFALLQQVGLEGHERQRVGTYSQGMKKRFALASALLARPRNLLLDELLNGLDPEGIRSSRNLLMGLRHEGVAVLLSSHYLTEIEQLADRIAFVHKGRLIKLIEREELKRAPGSLLRVQVKEPDQKVLEYLGSLGTARADGRTFVLEGSKVDPSEVNGELVRRGYHVEDLHTEREDLESYFFRLIGEGS